MPLTMALSGLTISDSEPSQQRKREKGHSLLVVPSDYIILDLETTGLNSSFDSIIEVACMHMTDGKEISNFHSYVRPTPFIGDDEQKHYVDEFITELTGITDAMLEDAPTFQDIANSLLDFIGNSVIVGHNVNFDINFLYDNFLKTVKLKFNNDFVDTMRLSRIILPELPHHRLKDLAKLFEISDTQHRAMNDCKITQAILENLLKISDEKHIDLTAYKRHHKIDLSTLTCTDVSLNDVSHIFYNKNCVFTGKLQKYVRKEASQIICNIGGHCENTVTKNTNFLIIGGLDDNPPVKGGKSVKMKRAEKLISEGQDLQIISETTFYDLLNDYLNS